MTTSKKSNTTSNLVLHHWQRMFLVSPTVFDAVSLTDLSLSLS